MGRRVSVRRVVDRRPDGGLLLRRCGRRPGRPGRPDRRHRHPAPARRGAARRSSPRPGSRRRRPPTSWPWRRSRPAVGVPAETEDSAAGCCAPTDGFTAGPTRCCRCASPGVPLDEALAAAPAWYAERGLPLRFQVPAEARRLLDAELGERGLAEPRPDVARHDAPAGRSSSAPAARRRRRRARRRRPTTTGWRSTATARAARRPRPADPPRPRRLRLGRATDGAHGRRSAAAPSTTAGSASPRSRSRRHRGTGLARLMARALAWGAEQGATRSYLQVSADNAAALALYERLGYWHAPRLPLPHRAVTRRATPRLTPWPTAARQQQAARHLLRRPAARAGVPARRGPAAERRRLQLHDAVIIARRRRHLARARDHRRHAGPGRLRRRGVGPAARHALRWPDRRPGDRRGVSRWRRTVREVVDPGIKDETIAELRTAVPPGRTAVALLVSHVSVADLQRELTASPRSAGRDRPAARGGRPRCSNALVEANRPPFTH